MGALASKATASNELDAMIKAGVSVATSTAQSCFPRLSQQQIIQIANAHGNVDINGIKAGQTIFLDVNCMSTSSVTNDVQQQISSQLSQMANALVGGLSLGQSDANNLMKSTIDLSSAIANAFTQSCTLAASQQQLISVIDVGGNVHISNIDWDQFANTVLDCVQQTVVNTTAAQTIAQIIDQGAKAKNAGFLDFLGGMAGKLVLIVIAVVIGAVFLVPKILDSPVAAQAVQKMPPVIP